MALRDYSEEIGKRYGWLTVREVFSNGYEAVYRCDCDCGTKGFEITRNLLLKTKTPSCGCYRSPLNKAKRHVEKYGPRLIGKTIGSLTVHELHPTEEGAVAVCSCSFCGSDRCNVPLFRIVTEHCTTCGCYRRKDMRTAVALQKAKALVGTASGYLRVDSVRATDTGRIEAVCTCHSCGLTDVVVPAKAITEKKVTDCGCRATDERRRRKLAQARKRNRLKRMAEITEVQSEQQKVKPESVTAEAPTKALIGDGFDLSVKRICKIWQSLDLDDVCVAWRDASNFARWAIRSGFARGATLEKRDPTKPHHPNNSYWRKH